MNTTESYTMLVEAMTNEGLESFCENLIAMQSFLDAIRDPYIEHEPDETRAIFGVLVNIAFAEFNSRGLTFMGPF